MKEHPCDCQAIINWITQPEGSFAFWFNYKQKQERSKEKANNSQNIYKVCIYQQINTTYRQ